MKYYISDITKTLTSIAVAACLTACGGGGGGDGSNAQAAITGTTTGTVASGTSEATGTVTVTDSDAGQATFVQPTTLTGVYGAWAFVISGNTATWRYTLTTAPPTAVTETLSVRSQDGSAVQNITVSIAAGGGTSSALVTSVPAPVYSGTYAAEKVAVFNRLNDDRSRCGFGKLAQNSKLDLAAQGHADYIALNKTGGGTTRRQEILALLVTTHLPALPAWNTSFPTAMKIKLKFCGAAGFHQITLMHL